MNNLVNIAEINIGELHDLINTQYKNIKKKEVISKLSNKPEIQLIYAEILIKKISNTLRETEGILVDEDPQWVNSILKLHLKLLCILNQKERILPFLKECSLYPLEDATNICVTYQVYDALIYLYKKSRDIEGCLDLNNNHYDKICKI